jgi:hypothetical protein
MLGVISQQRSGINGHLNSYLRVRGTLSAFRVMSFLFHFSIAIFPTQIHIYSLIYLAVLVCVCVCVCVRVLKLIIDRGFCRLSYKNTKILLLFP